MPQAEARIPELLGEIADNLGNVVRNEIRLARAEVGKGAKDAASSAALMAGAAALAGPAVTILGFSAVYGLSQAGMDAWAAALIVAVVFGVAAFIMFSMGRKQLASQGAALEATSQNLKRDVGALKVGASALTEGAVKGTAS